MFDWLLSHWLVLLGVGLLGGLILRSVLRSRSRRRQLEEWARERRVQREREEREEEARRKAAREAAAARICTTEDQLAVAVGNGLAEITIEGKLAKVYATGSPELQKLGPDYQVVLARHGKVVLRRSEAAKL